MRPGPRAHGYAMIAGSEDARTAAWRMAMMSELAGGDTGKGP
jgi:hypothetical protein